MSNKIELKISVDSTDLDKLEAQLKRVEELMVSTGLKQPAKGGFTMDVGIFNPTKGCFKPAFTVPSGTTLINEACIEHATLEKVVLQAAKEGAKKGAEQARFEITTGVNDSREQQSAEIQTGANEEEKELARAIRKLLLKDVVQGGPLSRVLRCSR